MCVEGFVPCVVTPISDWLAAVWALIVLHFPWIGPLFGVAMAAWRWWDKRESVVWRRAVRLLGDQGKFVQDSCAYSLTAILYPSPATRPQEPVFAVSSLRLIFAQRWWHPLQTAMAMKWENGLLHQTHEQLNAKDTTIAQYRSFAVAQRYSAHVLQGALAAAYASNGTKTQSRIRLNESALDQFDAALALEGKSSDAVVLELKALQLRKLARVVDAVQELINLQALLQGRLQAVTPLLPAERQGLLVQLLRVVRYHGEIEHEMGAHGAANARLLGLTQNPVTKGVFQSHLEFQNRLARAQYHEVHACVRARLTRVRDPAGAWTLPTNGVAQQSLHDARSDYNALAGQVAVNRFSWPIRLWRWLNHTDSKDGTAKLRVAAAEGLRRVKTIEAVKGCQFCIAQNDGPGLVSP